MPESQLSADVANKIAESLISMFEQKENHMLPNRSFIIEKRIEQLTIRFHC